MRVYWAAPLFTMAEREFNRRCAGLLREQGHEVWLPQEHEPREGGTQAIYDEDMRGLAWCEVVVACLDGPDADSGTAFECGWARGRDKHLVVFRTDFRGGEMPSCPTNIMLWHGSDRRLRPCSLHQTTEDLCEGLCKIIASLPKTAALSGMSHVDAEIEGARLIREGRSFSDVLTDLRALGWELTPTGRRG